jgi:hypothetical protein
MKRNFKTLSLAVGVSAFAVVGLGQLASCGKKSKSNPDTTEETKKEVENTINKEVDGITSELSSAFPSGLNLSAFPSTTTTASLDDEPEMEYSLDEAATVEEGDTTSPKQKFEEQKKLLNGEGDCLPRAFKFDKKGKDETCYEFDQDMLYSQSTVQNPGGGTTQRILGTKDGKASNGEACMVSFARAQILNVQEILDKNKGMVESMFCLAKKSKKAKVLEVDEALDLKEVLGGDAGFSKFAKNISEAKISRLKDSDDGRPVFKTSMVLSDPAGKSRTIQMIHSPFATKGADGKTSIDNEQYNGTLWSVQSEGGAPGGSQMDPTHSANKYRAMSITYRRYKDEAGTVRVGAELRTAQMKKELFDGKAAGDEGSGFEAGGVLNLNAGTDDSGNFKTDPQNANSSLSSVRYVAFDVNPENFAGNLSYWQNPGGNYKENTRGFLFKMDANATDGTLSGCAVSGAASSNFGDGYSIRRALKEAKPELLKPQGYWHPFLNVPAQGQPAQNCQDKSANPPTQGTFSAPVTANGETYITCTANSVEQFRWYKPVNAGGQEVDDFYRKDSGGLISKQCFKQQTETKKYVIDTAQTTGAAGYDLIQVSTQSDKVLPPPPLGSVKPILPKK